MFPQANRHCSIGKAIREWVFGCQDNLCSCCGFAIWVGDNVTILENFPDPPVISGVVIYCDDVIGETCEPHTASA